MVVAERRICEPCAANNHAWCYYWERRRAWDPCDCNNALHVGKPRPFVSGLHEQQQ